MVLSIKRNLGQTKNFYKWQRSGQVKKENQHIYTRLVYGFARLKGYAITKNTIQKEKVTNLNKSKKRSVLYLEEGGGDGNTEGGSGPVESAERHGHGCDEELSKQQVGNKKIALSIGRECVSPTQLGQCGELSLPPCIRLATKPHQHFT